MLLLAAGAFAQEQPVVNPHATAADREAGAKMFRSHCAPCHGPDGHGGYGPNLAAGVFFHGKTDADLYRNITEGIPGTAMPGVFFDGNQAWQIVAYVRSLSANATHGPTGGVRTRGEELFRAEGCNGCHSVKGEGGDRGPDLTGIGAQRSAEYLKRAIVEGNGAVPVRYWVANVSLTDGTKRSGFVLNQDTYTIQLLDFERGLASIPKSRCKGIAVSRDSIMPKYKGKLPDRAIDDLVAYLSSLKPEAEAQ